MNTTAASSFIQINGLRIHYVDWGNSGATPMVLLHGLRGYAHWFDEFAEVAKNRFHVVAYDQRGRGDSDRAQDGDYTREAYVTDLEAFVDALDIDKFVLVGHSMGGLNAFHYTVRHPDRVLALLDVDIGPDIDPKGMERIRRELGETPERFDTWAQAEAFLKERHPAASDETRATRKRWMFREAVDNGVDWRIDPAIFDPNLRHDPPEQTWAALEKIQCPTLIVRGAESDIFTRDSCNEMVARIAGSRAVEIPNAGHMVIEDNPEAFNNAVLDFLDNDVAPIV